MLYKFISENMIMPCPRNGVTGGKCVSNLLEFYSENPEAATADGFKTLTVTEKPAYDEESECLCPVYADSVDAIIQTWRVISMTD